MKQIFFFILSICITSQIFSQSKKTLKLHKKVTKNLHEWKSPHHEWNHVGKIKIDTFSIKPDSSILEIQFSTALSYIPIREDSYELTHNSLREKLGKKFKDYTIRITTNGQRLETLIPNYYRKTMEIDSYRFAPVNEAKIPIVRRLANEIPSKGLYNRNIALWHSHGWYYEAKLDRWEWQRARLFGTVEDIFPMTFVLPYLAPMLENAGANVFLPRERDIQIHEVIVDNDRSSQDSELAFSGIEPQTIHTNGFILRDTLYDNENPFQMGSHIRFRPSLREDQFVDYIPCFPADGDYALYISYQHSPQNITNAKYVVSHSGGKTTFLINQQMGGGTWIYLGTFHFKKGKQMETGSVRLSALSEESGWITTDAVRFGGGMGNVARKPAAELMPNLWSLKGSQTNGAVTHQTNPGLHKWKTSKRPRYHEGARYYLQYTGAPDSLVYSLNEEKNDYNDDYQSRGEWVNYLMGAPNGPNDDRNARGLNIPIDLSLAFHTDAGTAPKDSTIGTLAIYSSVRDMGKFPNGQSKMVSRDLTDMIQSEIVHDIRTQFKPDWSRRGLWNKQYSEAWRPNVPAMLLELLSHQNITDMEFGHDPRFKFAVSRAIYKGVMKFLAFQKGSDYIIQPLPVDHFSISHLNNHTIRLSWEPVLDPLEPTATPTRYKVYKRTGDSGFDNGRVVLGNTMDLEIGEFGKIYSFKVTALNEGGESFPSEILSIGTLNNNKNPILVINGFDRISGPAVYDEGDFAGIAHWEDEGVPDKFNIGYVGEQYDFNRKSLWMDDDSPGWGASYGDMEGKRVPGNSFDNTIIHGKAIMKAWHSFISISDEAFSDPYFDTSPYTTIDLILGEEKTTPGLKEELFKTFDEDIMEKITQFTKSGGNVLASGAYIGSDFVVNNDTIVKTFASDVLHYKWRTNHAVKMGKVYATDYSKHIFSGNWTFNSSLHPAIYKVEAPDAIEPNGEGAITAFRYTENNTSAGTAFMGNYKTVILGFPFETIIEESERFDLMKQILTFFEGPPSGAGIRGE